MRSPTSSEQLTGWVIWGSHEEPSAFISIDCIGIYMNKDRAPSILLIPTILSLQRWRPCDLQKQSFDYVHAELVTEQVAVTSYHRIPLSSLHGIKTVRGSVCHWEHYDRIKPCTFPIYIQTPHPPLSLNLVSTATCVFLTYMLKLLLFYLIL